MIADQENSARYIERAAELRNIAAMTRDPTSRATLIRAAEAYERMAAWTPIEPISRNET